MLNADFKPQRGAILITVGEAHGQQETKKHSPGGAEYKGDTSGEKRVMKTGNR